MMHQHGCTSPWESSHQEIVVSLDSCRALTSKMNHHPHSFHSLENALAWGKLSLILYRMGVFPVKNACLSKLDMILNPVVS